MHTNTKPNGEGKKRKKKKMRPVKGRQDINYICNTLLSSFLSEQIELIYGFGLIHIVSESEREGEVERVSAKWCQTLWFDEGGNIVLPWFGVFICT